MTEEFEGLLQQIGSMGQAAIPNNALWSNLTLEFRGLTTFAALKGYYFVNGENKSFNPQLPVSSGEENLTAKFIRLREIMYEMEPAKGAWYTAIFELSAEGKFKMNYEYDEKPKFKYEPSPEQYIEDAKRFPRSGEYIPKWLKEILAKNS